jgi:hypothetical protein
MNNKKSVKKNSREEGRHNPSIDDDEGIPVQFSSVQLSSVQ